MIQWKECLVYCRGQFIALNTSNHSYLKIWQFYTHNSAFWSFADTGILLINKLLNQSAIGRSNFGCMLNISFFAKVHSNLQWTANRGIFTRAVAKTITWQKSKFIWFFLNIGYCNLVFTRKTMLCNLMHKYCSITCIVCILVLTRSWYYILFVHKYFDGC